MAFQSEISVASLASLTVKAVLILCAWSVLKFIFNGIRWRQRFLKLKAQGIPIMEPYSPLFGHLPIYKKIVSEYPPDAAQPGYAMKHITDNWEKYFPNATTCPPLICVDFWPLSRPLLWVIDPDQAHKFTAEKPVLKNQDVQYWMWPMTKGRDLISLACDPSSAHRIWRARLAPGFSMRNLLSHMPVLVDETLIFANMLKSNSGKDGSWGCVFTLEEPSINLTMDIIARVALDVQLHEQTTGPSPFQMALKAQLKEVKLPSLFTQPRHYNPFWHYRNWKSHQTMDRFLNSQIQAKLGASDSESIKQNTIIDLAVKAIIEEESSGKAITSKRDLMRDILAQLKVFMFAGHDTTASSICWSLLLLQRHPNILQKVQQEHDDVFGLDPSIAPQVLKSSPQKINELPLTLGVVKETLRLYPLVFGPRQGSSSLELTAFGKVMSTEGFMVTTGWHSMSRHPDLWSRPHEFLPERWLVPKDDPLAPPRHAWRPFEFGPYNCVGQELVLIMLRLVLVLVVRDFEVETSWEEYDKLRGNQEIFKIWGDRAYQSRAKGGMAKTKDGFPVHVRLRSK